MFVMGDCVGVCSTGVTRASVYYYTAFEMGLHNMDIKGLAEIVFFFARYV